MTSSMRLLVSDLTPGVWGRPRGTSAGLYRGPPISPDTPMRLILGTEEVIEVLRGE